MSVGPGYVRMMAAYNSEMNRRLYEAAGRLTEGERRLDRGAFWRSIHGTLAHLVWADRQWMHRFDGWEANTVALAESGGDGRGFATLRAERVSMDTRIEAWGRRVDGAWLEADMTWFSGAAGREMSRPYSLLVPHFFNHQTHHRGQAHALITGAGERTGDTDLWMLV